MKRILVAAPFVVFAGAAFAHTSLAPHQHPHAASALAGLDTLLLAGLTVGFGAALACALRRR